MATLNFTLRDTSKGTTSVAHVQNGTGSGCDIDVLFDSRVVSSAVAQTAFYAFAATVTAG